ncbi:hypothetical protein K438DRAFT_1780918 [Mycena galopus ATCC 62051]|nr:hypothetical protein K438DRAFT_1780918 [Mycena galopus ATCC 62051]
MPTSESTSSQDVPRSLSRTSSPPPIGVGPAAHTITSTVVGNTGSTLPGLKLVPIAPEGFQRYTPGRRRTITKHNTDYIVPPLCRSISCDPLPDWIAERPLEGGLFCPRAVHAYLYDATVFAQISSVVGQLLVRAEVQDLLMAKAESSHVDIVLDLMTENPDNDECGYYFVDHSARVVFWLDAFSMSKLDNWNQIPGIDTPSHVRHRVHCEYFPTAMPISPKVVDELCDAIIYGIGDAMSSPTTTQQFSIERLSRMLTLTKEMSCEPIPGPGEPTGFKMNPGSTAVFGIIFQASLVPDLCMNLVQLSVRPVIFHGEKTPRLNSDQSVYGSTPKRSYALAWISTLLLFNLPLRYLQTLQVTNTDRMINYASWQRFITALRTEWLDLVLYGTLILNTNVGFLSTPASGCSTAGQVASYASICFGVASIILGRIQVIPYELPEIYAFLTGILLLRQHQAEFSDVPDFTRAAQLFYDHGSSAHGLEVWAIVLSLPFALTIWAMITFILAFLITIFETSSAQVRGIMFATVLTVSLAIAGFVWTQKRFGWVETLTQTKTKIKHSTSSMWRDWRSPRPDGPPGISGAKHVYP